MKRKIAAGTTSLTLPFFAQDTSSSTGGGLAGLASLPSGLIGEYRRQGQSSWTSITLSAGTLGTWSSGGIAADGTLVGAYEFGAPDAAVASGARWVSIRLRGAANMLPVLIEIELDAVNYQDGVRFGLTALPNVAAAAVGGMGVLNANSLLDVAVQRWLTNIPNATLGGRIDVAPFTLHGSTAQAGASTSITLSAGASAVDNYYQRYKIYITGATGAGQRRMITAYNGTTKVATIAPAWLITPDNTSTYLITAEAGEDVEMWGAAVPNALVSGRVDASAGAVADKTGYTAATVQDKTGYSLATPPPTAANIAAAILATPANLLATDATGRVTVGSNADKTGYALTAGEHTSIGTDVQTGLTAQGYTTTRAGYLDTLNGLVAAIWANASRTLTGFGTLAADVWANATRTLSAFAFTPNVGNVTGTIPNATVGGYATGQDPATLLLATPANKLATNATGQVSASNLPTDYQQRGVAVTLPTLPNVTVGGYATGEDPATLVLATPANKLATDASGNVAANNLPTNYATAANLTTLQGTADAIKAKTDNLTATPASTGDTMVMDLTPLVTGTFPDGSIGHALQSAISEAIGKIVYTPPSADPGTGSIDIYAYGSTTTVLKHQVIQTDASGNIISRV